MLQTLPLRLRSSVVGVRTATTLAFHQASRRRWGSSNVAASAAMAPAGRGALIVFEGLDRSGKSSQCAHLASFLQAQGVGVEAWRFPDRTTAMGHMISSYLSCQTDLDDAAIHLLFSANRWEKRYYLMPPESVSMPLDEGACVSELRIFVAILNCIYAKGEAGFRFDQIPIIRNGFMIRELGGVQL